MKRSSAFLLSSASLKFIGALSFAGALLIPSPAFALQTLDELLAAAKTGNLEQREARETAKQREAEADQATAHLFPTLSARAAYTLNQREVATDIPADNKIPPTLEHVVITPKSQLDGTFTATVPIIDVGAWMRISATSASAEAAKLRAKSTANDVEKSVTRQYFQVLASEAGVVASQKALAVAEESRKIMATRKDAGSASDLELERARAQVERSKQALATAEQLRNVARRQLQTMTGLVPSEGSAPLPEDKLEDAPAPATLEPAVATLPNIQAAQADVKAADRNATSAWAALAPTVTGNATERLTNATGFGGQVGTWSIGLVAQITLDPTSFFNARAQEHAKGVAEVRLARATLVAKDALFTDSEEVKAQIAKVKAAAAELDANVKAAKLARDRYATGAATQLDIQQADRDVFNAEVAKIQAQADLAYARALVKIDSGRGTLKDSAE